MDDVGEARVLCGPGRPCGLGAVGDKGGQPGLCGLTAQLFMSGRAHPAQFQHIAQQSEAALAGVLFEHRQRSLHAVGVGVVAVLDDVHAACVDHLLAHTGLLEIGQTRDDALGREAQTGGGGVSSQRVRHVVTAHGRDGHCIAACIFITEGEGHAVALLPDIEGADVGVLVAEAEPHGPDMGGQSGFAQEGVVAVEHEGRTLGKAGADLQLRLADVLLTAQIADVGHADAGDDAHIGAGALCQTLDLTGVAHAHLHDSVLRIPADAEHGAGQAQLIVLVALGLDCIAKARDGGVGHLLGGGLAHTAGDAHHLRVELAAVVRAHDHHGVVAVGADNRPFSRDALHRMVEDDIGRALFQRLGREIVAVEALTGESHKDAAGADLAAVGGHEADGLAVGEALGGKALQKQVCCDFFHKSFSLI